MITQDTCYEVLNEHRRRHGLLINSCVPVSGPAAAIVEKMASDGFDYETAGRFVRRFPKLAAFYHSRTEGSLSSREEPVQ